MRQPRAPYTKGKVVYWSAWNEAGQVWDGTGMVDFGSGNALGYGTLMDDPMGVGDYEGALPATAPLLPDGKYRIRYFERIGATVDVQTDTLFWIDEEFYIVGGVGQELRDITSDNVSVIVENS